MYMVYYKCSEKPCVKKNYNGEYLKKDSFSHIHIHIITGGVFHFSCFRSFLKKFVILKVCNKETLYDLLMRKPLKNVQFQTGNIRNRRGTLL